MFTKSAQFYDAIYAMDRAEDLARLEEFIQWHKRSSGNALLAIARQRNPDVPFHHADMT